MSNHSSILDPVTVPEPGSENHASPADRPAGAGGSNNTPTHGASSDAAGPIASAAPTSPTSPSPAETGYGSRASTKALVQRTEPASDVAIAEFDTQHPNCYEQELTTEGGKYERAPETKSLRKRVHTCADAYTGAVSTLAVALHNRVLDSTPKPISRPMMWVLLGVLVLFDAPSAFTAAQAFLVLSYGFTVVAATAFALAVAGLGWLIHEEMEKRDQGDDAPLFYAAIAVAAVLLGMTFLLRYTYYDLVVGSASTALALSAGLTAWTAALIALAVAVCKYAESHAAWQTRRAETAAAKAVEQTRRALRKVHALWLAHETGWFLHLLSVLRDAEKTKPEEQRTPVNPDHVELHLAHMGSSTSRMYERWGLLVEPGDHRFVYRPKEEHQYAHGCRCVDAPLTKYVFWAKDEPTYTALKLGQYHTVVTKQPA